MTDEIPRPLSRSEVRFEADLSALGISTSDDLSPSTSIVGQPQALESLTTGLALRAPGFNVFVTGNAGTGRFAAIREMIERVSPTCPIRRALLYVHDFKKPNEPLLLEVPPGTSAAIVTASEILRTGLKELVPSLLDGEALTRGGRRLQARFGREIERLFARMDERAKQAEFALVRTQDPSGEGQSLALLPMVAGEPRSFEDLQTQAETLGVSPEDLQRLERRQRGLQDDLAVVIARQRQIASLYRRLGQAADGRRVAKAIRSLTAPISEAHGTRCPNLNRWLDHATTELSTHLELFRDPPELPAGQPSLAAQNLDAFLDLLRVNVLVEPGAHDPELGPCPFVEEHFPTWRNIFGAIDASGEPPNSTFMDIKAGGLIRANGGFIVLSARDVLGEPKVYEHLKRTLRRGLLEIAPRDEAPGPSATLKPEPIPLQVKLIFVGEPSIYSGLLTNDPDFARIFKVKVEFDEVMERYGNNTRAFLAAVRRIIEDESLPTFDRAALEVVVDEGVRLAGDRRHLSTSFSEIADILREASHLASSRESGFVTGNDVRSALEARRRRHGLAERHLLADIRSGTILIEVDGWRVGQINGLGFYDLSDTSFGLPLRITATTAVGRGDLVSIERESRLSGSVHDKGVLILSGFLGATFAQDKPLSLLAHLAFEQSYGVIDGDSASLAELLVLLSSLARIPLRQDIAVTGSLNQFGDIQPVGGVTEKAQGFFRVCRARGLTGRQGVVIPATNIDDLQLDAEMADAVLAGKFFVWGLHHWRQAVALLSEQSPEEVLNQCDATLKRFAEIARRSRSPD